MRTSSLWAAALALITASAAAETTLICRGRVTETTIAGQNVGDTATDVFLVDDATKTVSSDGKPQPVAKFSAQAIEIAKGGPKARALISIDRVSGAYALRMIGEDPPLKLTVLGDCRDASQAAVPGERIDTLTGSVYTSPSLGIVLKIPAGWETRDAEMEKRMASLPEALSRRTLLTLVKLGKEQAPEAMLIITAEKVVGNLTAKDYVEAGRAVSRKRPGISAVSDVAMESIGPKQFATSTITMGSGKDAMFVKTYARIHGENVLLFVLTYIGARQRYESEQLLASIQYK